MVVPRVVHRRLKNCQTRKYGAVLKSNDVCSCKKKRNIASKTNKSQNCLDTFKEKKGRPFYCDLYFVKEREKVDYHAIRKCVMGRELPTNYHIAFKFKLQVPVFLYRIDFQNYATRTGKSLPLNNKQN